MKYKRPIDAPTYCKKLKEETTYIREHPEQYKNPSDIIDGLEIAIADLGETPTLVQDGLFQIIYEGDYYALEYTVYSIDTVKHKFLITDSGGWFKWVDTNDCRLAGECEDD